MDALDMQDAAMQGVARYMEWRTQFLGEWKLQFEIGNLMMAFAMMPPAMKEMIRTQMPAEYEQLMSMSEMGRT